MQRPPPPPIQMYSMADDRDGWIQANETYQEGVEMIEISFACSTAVQSFDQTIMPERFCVLPCHAARAARACRPTATGATATAPTAAPSTTRSTTRGRRATGARGTTAATAASPSARATATPPPTPSGRPSRWRRPSRRATGTVRHVRTVVVNRYANRRQVWDIFYFVHFTL